MKNTVIITTPEQLMSLINKAMRQALQDHQRAKPEDTKPDLPEILTIDQAAQFLNLAKPTIYAKTSRGEIPHFKTGKKLYFKRSELIQWIENGKR